MFLEVFIIGVLVGFLAVFLNYCIGKPGSEKFSPYEIFSFYTVWLSKRRLKQVGLYAKYKIQYKENTERATAEHDLIAIKNDFKKIYYEAAEPFFTWERAAGMCPICFGVWVAFICFAFWVWLIGSFIVQDLINLAIIVIISHVVIRLLIKII